MAERSEDRFAPLEAAARAWAALSDQTVRQMYGLPPEPWRITAALYRHGMLPQSCLAALCHTHKVAVSRAVESLVVEKRWVMRVAYGSDGRLRHLVLTDKGRAEAEVVVEALAELRHLSLAGISDIEMTQMADLLRRVEDGVRRVA